MKVRARKLWRLAIAVALLAISQAALAQTNLVQNGSFEGGYPGDFICGNWWYNVGWLSSDCRPERVADWNQAIPGWQQTGEGVNWYALGPFPEPVPPDGDHSVDLIGGGAGRIEQLVPTTPGTVYTLSFRYARHAACSSPGVSATVMAGTSSSVVVSQVTGTSPTDWEVASFTFAGAPAPAATTRISFESNQGLVNGLCGGVLVDFVSVEAGAVLPPEPPPTPACTPPQILVDGVCVDPVQPPEPPQTVPPTIDAIGVLTDGTVGVAYTHTFTAQGTPPFMWDFVDGALPAGLTLSPAGVLSGTPTTAAHATFTIRAYNPGGTATAAVNLNVVPAVVEPPQPSMPQSREECKKDGWRSFGVFRNQGDCVSYVVTNGRNPPAR
jgi:hypothetical protein